MFIINFLWAWVLPYIGPLLPPILRNIPGVETVNRWLRRGLIALTVIGALGLGYLVLKSLRNPVDDYVSAAEVNARLLTERNKQIQTSVQELHQTLNEREAEKAALETELKTLRKAMEDARAKSPDPDVVVFPADDPWLRAKRRR